jgi:anion-transporting  ArsA/GET3 family ATPase
MLMTPTRAYMKAVNVAAQAFVRTVGKIVGGEVLDDALSFFQAFEGMEAGFRQRAAAVQSLLTAEETAYVLVASPRSDTVDEATYFARKLAQTHLPVEALIVNRMHPRFGDGRAEADRARAATLAGTPIGALYANLADFRQMADQEEGELVGLAEQIAPAPIVRVPFLADDVHDLGTLAEIGSHLF